MPRPADLQTGLQRAREFLLRARDPADGLWRDFTSTAGRASEWVAGFVLASLAGWDIPEARSTRRALLGRQRGDGSWGFCSRVPGDADSTAWVVLGLGPALTTGHGSRAGAFLLTQQRQGDGGFRTYPGAAAGPLSPWAPRDHDYRGWQASHTCVSGTALLALQGSGAAGAALTPARRQAAARYLIRRQDPCGIWPSYWWSGVAYSTCQALRALQCCGELPVRTASRAADELARRQLPGGGWAWDGSCRAQAGAFETAFALLGLLVAERSGAKPSSSCIRRGLDALIRSQSPAGRWVSQPILRVPLPSDQREWLGTHEAPARTGGLGRDDRGVFTAAAVANCLMASLERFPGTQTAAGAPTAQRTQATADGRAIASTPSGAGARAGQRSRPPASSPVLRYLAIREAQAAFAQTMSSYGLAITPAARAAILERDRRHGRRVAASLPAPAPGCVSFTERWRREIRSTLGFGWGMTDALAAWQSLPSSPRANELGAVFMLGTAAVDRLCDSDPGRRDALLARLNREQLHAAAVGLADDPPLRISRGAADPDTRYALELAEAFFHRLRQCRLDEFWHAQVCGLLIQAYDAECATLGQVAMSPARPAPTAESILRAHQAARVLPFRVITAIQCGLNRHECARYADRRRGPHGPGAPQLGLSCAMAAELLGEAIASLDDLADLCGDAEQGTANSLIVPLPGQLDLASAAGLREPDQVLVAALASGACWRAATTVAQRLTRLLAGPPPAVADGHPRARQRILAHLWGWGSLGRPALDFRPARTRPVAAHPGERSARDGLSRA